MRRTLILLAIVLATSPVAAYIPQTNLIDGSVTAVKWAGDAFPITWQMNPTVGSNVTGSRGQAVVFRNSFEQWADVSTALVSFTEGAATNVAVKPGFDQINVITTNVTTADFTSSALGLTSSFSFTTPGLDEFGRTIDFPGQIIEADIMFNPQTTYSTNETTPEGAFDLASIATHEVGHLLGLDHSNILSSTMFPTVVAGASFPRDTEVDDRIGISTIYPATSFADAGALSGTVRTTANVVVFGALVVAVDSNGQAMASAVTDPNGEFTIRGLEAGSYTVYAEPMNQPFTSANVFTLAQSFPGNTVNSGFTVRFR